MLCHVSRPSLLWCQWQLAGRLPCAQFSSEASEGLRAWAGSDPAMVLALAKQCFLELSTGVGEMGVTRQAIYGALLGQATAKMEQASAEPLQYWEKVSGGEW